MYILYSTSLYVYQHQTAFSSGGEFKLLEMSSMLASANIISVFLLLTSSSFEAA